MHTNNKASWRKHAKTNMRYMRALTVECAEAQDRHTRSKAATHGLKQRMREQRIKRKLEEERQIIQAARSSATKTNIGTMATPSQPKYTYAQDCDNHHTAKTRSRPRMTIMTARRAMPLQYVLAEQPNTKFNICANMNEGMATVTVTKQYYSRASTTKLRMHRGPILTRQYSTQTAKQTPLTTAMTRCSSHTQLATN